MSLQPIVFSNEFIDDMNAFVSLTSEGVPRLDSEGNVVLGSGDFPFLFASAYETYSLTGEVLGAIHGAQTPSIIESYLRTFSNSIVDFATALANYWSTVLIVPGAPAHGGVSVVSVVNDAASQVSAFVSAITASLTQDYKLPIMLHLNENIESIALPQVTWTVTELMPNGSTQQFTEKVF